MTASLRIVLNTKDDVLRVPATATRFRPNADIYTALGLEPPAAGRGNAPANAGSAPGAPGTAVTPVTPGNATPGTPGVANSGDAGRGGNRNRQSGQGAQTAGQGANRNASSTGFGRGNPTLTPEQIAAYEARNGRGSAANIGAGGGRGGGGNNRTGGQGGGRGGGGRQGANVGGDMTPLSERNATTIDELWEEIETRITPSQVWQWTPAAKPGEKGVLKETKIRVGISDGTFMELVSGEGLNVGDKVITGVIIPNLARPGQPNTQSPFNQQQQNRGMPGMGNPGGGGGNPGGGGRGGGGGGRGGN
jgi:hypothetical protein